MARANVCLQRRFSSGSPLSREGEGGWGGEVCVGNDVALRGR